MTVMPLVCHLICCGGSVLLLAIALWRLRGTTLVSPLVWSIGAVSSIAIAEVVLFFPPMPGVTSWQSLVRYIAGTLTLLPTISILGAKRPQAIVWNYIVASLWIVLVMPAVEVLLLKPQQTFEIYAFGPWMIAGLIFYTAIHYAGTRMSLPGLLVATAQVFYLAGHFPLVAFDLKSNGGLMAAGLILLAAVLAFLLAPRSAADAFTLLWAQYKFAFGTAWSLRMQQRLDELQARHRWAVRLGWNGVVPTNLEAPNDEIQQSRKALARAFRSLMLRFLSARQLAPFSAAELRQKTGAPVSTKADA